MVQVPGLDQQDALGLLVFTDDVVGTAHTLSSRLIHTNQMQLKHYGSFCMESLETELIVPLAAHRCSESS